MKGRHPWGWPAALVWALSILPLVAASATPPAASEQWSAVELPQPLARETIRELVARLSDGEVRTLLLAQLDKAASPTASAPAAPMATGLAGDIDRSRTEIDAVLRSWRELPAALGVAVTRFSEGRARSHLLLVASLLGGASLRGARRRSTAPFPGTRRSRRAARGERFSRAPVERHRGKRTDQA